MLPTALAQRVPRWRETLPSPAARLLGAVQVVAGSIGVARRDMAEERLIEQAARGQREAGESPPGYNERIVEIPWALTRVETKCRVLDVGTANAPVVYRRLLRRLEVSELHLVDLAAVKIEGAVAHQADIRALPMPDDRFDVVLCISTLEHIGMANDQYFSQGGADDARGDVAALRELGRVTRPGGRILVTVPGGREDRLDWLRQYSPDSWADIVQQAGLLTSETSYFALEPHSGWRGVSGQALEGVDYDQLHHHARGVICAALTPSAPT